MENVSKANAIDSERKILKELFKLLFIAVLTTLNLQRSNAQPGDIPIFELNAFDAEEIFTEFPENTTLLLDSVYELEHYELFTEYRRWYYYYNDLNQLDSSYRYFYDKYGENTNIVEIRTFNANGKLTKYILRQPVELYYRGINSSIEEFIEEYKYEDGNLVSKIEIRKIGDFQDTTDYYYYIYNEQGKLVYDSTYDASRFTISKDSIYASNWRWSVSNYTYDSLNRLVSILRHYSYNDDSRVEKYSYDSLNRLVSILKYYSSDSYDSYWIVEKYSYEKTDTSLLTLKQTTERLYSESEIPPIIDTITEFDRSRSICWTFNKEGQKASLEVIHWSMEYGEEKRVRAEYEYTQQGKLLHAVNYANWLRTKYEGEWMETSLIDNTYDEQGNLLVYEKTMYDGRTGEWIVTNRNEYYYSPAPVILGTGENKLAVLKLYPNPVQNILHLQGDFSPNSSYYKIVNLEGIIISRGTVIRNTIDVSRLNPGLYIIIVETDSGLHTGKFAKY